MISCAPPVRLGTSIVPGRRRSFISSRTLDMRPLSPASRRSSSKRRTLSGTDDSPDNAVLQRRPSSAAAQEPEKGADVLHQLLRLLKGSEMASRRHLGPALNIVDAFRPRTRRCGDFLREACDTRRNRHTLAWAQAPGMMPHLVVQTRRRVDRLRNSVNYAIGE